ncbi:MAG: DNA-directed RNA polymerase subunit H [Candidatus Micrarchaeota archaeon]
MSDRKDILSHVLVPEHSILTKSDEEGVLASFKITRQQLPQIRAADPVVKAIGGKEGDVVKIAREDATGENAYYRLVVK